MKHIRSMFIMTVVILGISFSQPKLSVNKPEIDLGIIYGGMKKQGKIVLTNIGNDTLRIYAIQPSCGCTAVKQPKDLLLPSKSDTVEVEFNSTGYHGKVEKHINITSSDPSSRNVSITLFAEVKEELEPISHSTSMWLGNIGLGKPSMQETSLKNISDHTIKIKNFTTSSPSISVTIEKKILNPNDTLQVHVTIKPEKLGYGSDFFTIETDSKNQPLVEMRISYVCIKEN